MNLLCTLAEAQAHLRDYYAQNEADIQLKLYAASQAVLNYLEDGADSFTDSAGNVYTDSNDEPEGVPYPIKAATLLLLGELYKNREGEQGGRIDASFGYGYLPQSVISLLYPYRLPVSR